MFRKFKSFSELNEEFARREGVALQFAEEDGPVQSVTYAELSEMIDSEVLDARAECRYEAEILRAENNPDTVVRIFANVIAGCDVIMADPLMTEEAVGKAAEAAERLREEKAAQRDVRGRLITEKREGELLFFTSGTSSRSKIVRLTSESLCTSAWSGQSMLACGEDDRILSILPLSHVFGFVCGMLWGLAYGATISLGRDVRYIIEDAAFFNPTIIPVVPSIIAAMLKLDALGSDVKTVLIGAAPCGRETIEALRAKGIAVYLGYGLTETSSGIAITQDLDEPEALYPCPGADIVIEKDGEITVATPCMMKGYIGAVPMFDKDRFFTGDLGWMDDKGRLHLKGRKKDVLVMADGTKIFCPEYERDIREMTGEKDIAVIMKGGHAVLAAGAGSDIEALKKAVAEYNCDHLRSQQIYDVIGTGEELPRTKSGKIRRYRIQEKLEEEGTK